MQRLGSNTSHPIDVRVVCATSRNLQKMLQEGTFREDLYFRISVVTVPMPALRDRRDDIPLLAEYFLKLFARNHNRRCSGFTVGYLSALASHEWPGNVRELQNVIERSLVLADDQGQLGVADLPPELRSVITCRSFLGRVVSAGRARIQTRTGALSPSRALRKQAARGAGTAHQPLLPASASQPA